MQKYPSDWNQRRKRVYQRDNYTCQRCGTKGGPYGNAEIHAHHRIPISQGGGHELSNLVSVCRSCHEAIHGHPIGGGRRNTRSTSFLPNWANPPYNLRQNRFSDDSETYINYLNKSTELNNGVEEISYTVNQLFDDLESINSDSYKSTTDEDIRHSFKKTVGKYKKQLSSLDADAEEFFTISANMEIKPKECKNFDRRLLMVMNYLEKICVLSEEVLEMDEWRSIDVIYDGIRNNLKDIENQSRYLSGYAKIGENSEIKNEFDNEQEYEQYLLKAATTIEILTDINETVSSLVGYSKRQTESAIYGDGVKKEIKDDIKEDLNEVEEKLDQYKQHTNELSEMSDDCNVSHKTVMNFEEDCLKAARMIYSILDKFKQICRMESWNPVAETYTELTNVQRNLIQELRKGNEYELIGKELSHHIERERKVSHSQNSTTDGVEVEFTALIKHWVASVIVSGFSWLLIPNLGDFGIILFSISVIYFCLVSYLILDEYSGS